MAPQSYGNELLLFWTVMEFIATLSLQTHLKYKIINLNWLVLIKGDFCLMVYSNNTKKSTQQFYLVLLIHSFTMRVSIQHGPSSGEFMLSIMLTEEQCGY